MFVISYAEEKNLVNIGFGYSQPIVTLSFCCNFAVTRAYSSCV